MINSDVQILFLIFLVSFLFFVFVGVREGVEHQARNWFLIAWCFWPLEFSSVRKKKKNSLFYSSVTFSVKMCKNDETFQSSFRCYFECVTQLTLRVEQDVMY